MSTMQRSYEYQLTLLQIACNPIALLSRRIIFSLISFMLVMILWTADRVNLMMILIASFMVLCTVGFLWVPLFRGGGSYTPEKILLEFTPQGLRTNFSGILIAPSVPGLPYRFLSVHRGLVGCSVINNLNGGYVIVPKKILPYEEIAQLLKRLKDGAEHDGS